MGFYFNKNGTKTQIDMTSVDPNGTLWKYKTKPTAGSVSWKASTVGVGTVNVSYFNTQLADKNYPYWYKAIPTNAIYKIGFVIQQGKWWITEIEFRNNFSGTIRITGKSITNGAGTSGSYSTVVDQVGQGSVSNSRYAYAASGHFYSYGFGLGGYASTRYALTITATSTSGEVSNVVIPLIYGSSKIVSDGTNSVTVFNIMIESGMTASGYDPMQRNTTRITSQDMGDQSNPGHVWTSTFLNLNDLTFKI